MAETYAARMGELSLASCLTAFECASLNAHEHPRDFQWAFNRGAVSANTSMAGSSIFQFFANVASDIQCGHDFVNTPLSILFSVNTALTMLVSYDSAQRSSALPNPHAHILFSVQHPK